MKNNKGIFLKILIVTVCLALAAGLFTLLYRVKAKVDVVSVELGQQLDTSPSNFVTGMGWSVNLSKVDDSMVNTFSVGVYPLRVDHGWQHFQILVKVEDTTAPTLELVDEAVYLKVNEEYDVYKFVKLCDDLGGIDSLVVNDEETVSFGYCGIQKLVLKATDFSGNVKKEEIEVLVDTAPVLSGIREIYCATDELIDLSYGIFANDDLDGDVTDTVLVDCENLSMDTPGDYELKVSALDSFGLETIETTYLHVLEPVDVQEKLNLREINNDDYYIYGVINPYDAGYYLEDDIGNILEVMEPCVVHMEFPFDNGYSEGSGYIVAINDEKVIIATCAHVAREGLNRKCDLTFFDGTIVPAKIVGELNSFDDVAFMEVQKEDINEETLMSLRTVHVNNGLWEDLGEYEQISLGFRTIRKDGRIWADRTGVMLDKIGTCDVDRARDWIMTEVSCKNFPGSSGSAVFDGHGNLIAMVRAQSVIDGHYQYWCTTFAQIRDWYEAVFQDRLYYY